jgi:hypothetical protein
MKTYRGVKIWVTSIEGTGELHDLAALPPGKELPAPVG